MILCLGPTPALQRVMLFEHLELDAVNRAKSTVDGIAGKAVNVAKVLKILGEDPVVVGFAGGERGKVLEHGLEKRGITGHFVRCPEETRQCITIIDSRTDTQTELVEESKSTDARHYDLLLKAVKRLLAGAQALVMSGTLTPGAPTDFYRTCTELVHRNGLLS